MVRTGPRGSYLGGTPCKSPNFANVAFGVSSNKWVFVNLCETYITVTVWVPSVFLLLRAVTVCIYVFHHHQLDFANFASQPIIMEICKEFRVEWQSVDFFGMNENVGEGRGSVCRHIHTQLTHTTKHSFARQENKVVRFENLTALSCFYGRWYMALCCPTEGHRQEWSLRLDSIQHGKTHQPSSDIVSVDRLIALS